MVLLERRIVGILQLFYRVRLHRQHHNHDGLDVNEVGRGGADNGQRRRYGPSCYELIAAAHTTTPTEAT